MKLEQCKEGMEITKGCVLDCDLCYEITHVWDDCVTVKELALDDEVEAYRTTGNGGLIMAEELSEYEAY